jgi:hypothetical protein
MKPLQHLAPAIEELGADERIPRSACLLRIDAPHVNAFLTTVKRSADKRPYHAAPQLAARAQQKWRFSGDPASRS